MSSQQENISQTKNGSQQKLSTPSTDETNSTTTIQSRDNESAISTENLRWQTEETTSVADSVFYGQIEENILILLCDSQQANIEALARLLILLDSSDEDGKGMILERAMMHLYTRTKNFRHDLNQFVESIRAEMPQA